MISSGAMLLDWLGNRHDDPVRASDAAVLGSSRGVAAAVRRRHPHP